MAQQHRSTQRALDILSLLALCGDTNRIKCSQKQCISYHSHVGSKPLPDVLFS